eukprot:3914411-Rhodomonas_salina.1
MIISAAPRPRWHVRVNRASPGTDWQGNRIPDRDCSQLEGSTVRRSSSRGFQKVASALSWVGPGIAVEVSCVCVGSQAELGTPATSRLSRLATVTTSRHFKAKQSRASSLSSRCLGTPTRLRSQSQVGFSIEILVGGIPMRYIEHF